MSLRALCLALGLLFASAPCGSVQALIEDDCSSECACEESPDEPCPPNCDEDGCACCATTLAVTTSARLERDAPTARANYERRAEQRPESVHLDRLDAVPRG